MSTPIKYCLFVAAYDDKKSFNKLCPIMKRNLACGGFTVSPCDCNPPCRELTDEEKAALIQRFGGWPAPKKSKSKR